MTIKKSSYDKALYRLIAIIAMLLKNERPETNVVKNTNSKCVNKY